MELFSFEIVVVVIVIIIVHNLICIFFVSPQMVQIMGLDKASSITNVI
jgi:hypothetical protein